MLIAICGGAVETEGSSARGGGPGLWRKGIQFLFRQPDMSTSADVVLPPAGLVVPWSLHLWSC